MRKRMHNGTMKYKPKFSTSTTADEFASNTYATLYIARLKIKSGLTETIWGWTASVYGLKVKDALEAEIPEIIKIVWVPAQRSEFL